MVIYLILNLDWKPIPIIPKFVDIVVNGMSDRLYDIKAYAQDPASLKKRTAYAESILRDMQADAFLGNIKGSFKYRFIFYRKPRRPTSKSRRTKPAHAA